VEEAKGGEGVDGVVGAAVGAWSVERGGCEAGILPAGELGHGEAVGEWGGVAFGLERLKGSRGEEDGVEVEGIGCRSGDAEVAAVGWVKCAAEEGCAHEVLSLDPVSRVTTRHAGWRIYALVTSGNGCIQMRDLLRK